jgi:hypothetical protein
VGDTEKSKIQAVYLGKMWITFSFCLSRRQSVFYGGGFRDGGNFPQEQNLGYTAIGNGISASIDTQIKFVILKYGATRR